MHKRAEIRSYLAGLLTGLTTTAARVYTNRVYPINFTQPFLLINVDAEEIKYITIHEQLRVVQFSVRGVSKALDLEGELDDIASEVELAFKNNCTAYEYTHFGTKLKYNTVERPIGEVELLFQILYELII